MYYTMMTSSDTRYVYLIHSCLSHTFLSISYILVYLIHSCLSHTFLRHTHDTHCIRSWGYHRIHCMYINNILDTNTRCSLYAMMMISSDALYVYLIHSWYIYTTHTVLDHEDIIEYIVCLSHTFLVHIHDIHCIRSWWIQCMPSSSCCSVLQCVVVCCSVLQCVADRDEYGGDPTDSMPI